MGGDSFHVRVLLSCRQPTFQTKTHYLNHISAAPVFYLFSVSEIQKCRFVSGARGQPALVRQQGQPSRALSRALRSALEGQVARYYMKHVVMINTLDALFHDLERYLLGVEGSHPSLSNFQQF